MTKAVEEIGVAIKKLFARLDSVRNLTSNIQFMADTPELVDACIAVKKELTLTEERVLAVIRGRTS